MNRLKSLPSVALGALLPAIAARTAASLAKKGVRSGSNKSRPIDPDHPRTGWKEAILWAAIAGAVGGLARMGMTTWMNRHQIGEPESSGFLPEFDE